MNEIDLSCITGDELQDISLAIMRELTRRKGEKKLPMYVVGCKSMKSLKEALKYLQDECDNGLLNKRSPEFYFGDKTTGGVDQTLLELKVEFWSESEYNARPDVVWG